MPNLLSTEERMASWSIVSILLGFTWCVFQECSVLHIFLQFQSVHPIFSSPSGVCACRSKQLADHQNILLWWEYILFCLLWIVCGRCRDQYRFSCTPIPWGIHQCSCTSNVQISNLRFAKFEWFLLVKSFGCLTKICSTISPFRSTVLTSTDEVLNQFD